jgi:hypothetical protein
MLHVFQPDVTLILHVSMNARWFSCSWFAMLNAFLTPEVLQADNLVNLSSYNWSVLSQCPKRFPCLCYIWRKPYTYLAPTLTLSANGPKQDSTWPKSPRSCIRCIQNYFLSQWYVRHKACTYLASRSALSPNKLNRVSTWGTKVVLDAPNGIPQWHGSCEICFGPLDTVLVSVQDRFIVYAKRTIGLENRSGCTQWYS